MLDKEGSSPRQALPRSSPTPRTRVSRRCPGFPGAPRAGRAAGPAALAAPAESFSGRRPLPPGSPTWSGAGLGAERSAGRCWGRRGAAPPAPPSRSQVRGEPRPSRHRGYSIPHRERRPLPHARLQPTAASSPRSYRLLAAGRPSRRRSPAPARSARPPPPAARGRHPPPSRRRRRPAPPRGPGLPGQSERAGGQRGPAPPGCGGAGSGSPAAQDRAVRPPPRGERYREVSPRS